jgi:hypothetical protein
VAFKFFGLYRYWETIIDFKWQDQGSLSSLDLLQDWACTNLFKNISVNSLNMVGGALVFISFLTVGLETSFFEKQLALFKPQSS